MTLSDSDLRSGADENDMTGTEIKQRTQNFGSL